MGLLTLVDGQSKRRPNLKTVEKIMRNLHQNLSHVISQLLKRKKDLWRAVTACVLMRDGIKNSRGSLSSDLDQWQLSRLSYFYITSIKDLANPLHLISLRDVTLKLSFISFPWAQYPFFFFMQHSGQSLSSIVGRSVACLHVLLVGAIPDSKDPQLHQP